VLGICDFSHKTPRQSRKTLTWPKGPGFSGQNKPDDSMIPANLGVNPSLTITAMAEHAMSHIPPKEKE
jgi:hypothetical protein